MVIFLTPRKKIRVVEHTHTNSSRFFLSIESKESETLNFAIVPLLLVNICVKQCKNRNFWFKLSSTMIGLALFYFYFFWFMVLDCGETVVLNKRVNRPLFMHIFDDDNDYNMIHHLDKSSYPIYVCHSLNNTPFFL